MILNVFFYILIKISVQNYILLKSHYELYENKDCSKFLHNEGDITKNISRITLLLIRFRKCAKNGTQIE